LERLNETYSEAPVVGELQGAAEIEVLEFPVLTLLGGG
jgi:hypothetical protein